MAENITTYTTVIDVEVNGQGKLDELNNSTESSGEKFKSLRAQIRETTVQLQALADAGQEGSAEFQKLRTQLDDLNDAQERVSFQAGQFDDQLASLPGPLGAVGQGIQSFNEGLNRFSTSFKLAIGVVGLIVAAFAALKESLSRTEEGQKKLTQISEAFTKILNGIFAIIEPIAMALADLAVQFLSNDKVLSVLSKTFAGFAAIVKGTITTVVEIAKFIGNNFINAFKTASGVIGGFGKILKGAFTFDLDMIKKGLSEVGTTVSNSFDSFTTNVKDRYNGIKDGVSEAFSGAEANFKTGAKRLTELEKKNAEEAKKKREEAAKAAEEARQKALQERLKYLESIDKLDEAELDKQKQNALVLAKSEEEILRIEEDFARRSFEIRKKDLEDKRKLYPQNSIEYRNYTTELIKLDTEYTKVQFDNSKKRRELLEKELDAVGTYNDKLFEIGNIALKDETIRAEAARTQKFNKDKEALQKSFDLVKADASERASVLRLLEQGLQNDLEKIREDARKKENEKLLKEYDDRLKLLQVVNDGLIEGTRAYFDNRALVLNEAEARELAVLDLTEAQKTAIKEKYVKLRKQLDEDEVASYGRGAAATISAIGSVLSAVASSYDEEAKTSKEAFEKRKKLQKATAIMSAASGIIQILTQPSALISPFDFIVKGINAAALAVSTAVQIRQIDNTQFEGGGSSSTAKPSAPSFATPSIPTLETKAAPTITGAATKINPAERIAQTIATATEKSEQKGPLKAYVVSGEISSAQALDRRTTSAATFS